MRHSLEPEYRKYVKGYGFLSFANKYGKKLVDSAAKSGLKNVAKKNKKQVNILLKLLQKGY